LSTQYWHIMQPSNEPKTDTLVTPAARNNCTKIGFALHLIIYNLKASTRQTDGQTKKWTTPTMWPIKTTPKKLKSEKMMQSSDSDRCTCYACRWLAADDGCMLLLLLMMMMTLLLVWWTDDFYWTRASDATHSTQFNYYCHHHNCHQQYHHCPNPVTIPSWWRCWLYRRSKSTFLSPFSTWMDDCG